MADNQQSWLPYDGSKDCSQGFCSVYCPQWCYVVFPPPPPFSLTASDDDDSGTAFSPLVIVIIGVLATALVVFSYYTFVYKYRASLSHHRRHVLSRPTLDGVDGGSGGGHWQHQDGWRVSPTIGLDEAQINKITVCRYKRGEGLVEGTDCSVCLSEFRDEDQLRLLPKCTHAFHLHCIDTWLKSHSNCPLCRANILSATPAMPDSEAATAASLPTEHEQEMLVVIQDARRIEGEEELEEIETDGNDLVEVVEDIQPMRRSFSMNSSHQERVSIADVLQLRMEDEFMKKHGNGGEHCKGGGRSRGLHCVVNPMRMKRSVSCGRTHFTRQGRGKNSLLPV